MRTLKLSDTYSIKICETLEDINIKRFVAHKEWAIVKEQGLDFPKVKDVFHKFIRAVDEKSISSAVIAIYDYIRGLSYVQDREDANQIIFGLITLEDGEDVTNTDLGTIKEKLDRYSASGLTQLTVKEAVENFLQASKDN